MKDWCPYATWELIKCQKHFNELSERVESFIQEVKFLKMMHMNSFTSEWILNKLEDK